MTLRGLVVFVVVALLAGGVGYALAPHGVPPSMVAAVTAQAFQLGTAIASAPARPAARCPTRVADAFETP